MTGGYEPNLPFRWDVARDQLGTLLENEAEPDLWFADELVVCTARIIARSADGDLRFVGRSLDSAYDLLTGALAKTSWRGRIAQLPLSVRWGVSREGAQRLRTNLAELGLAPVALAQRRRPLVLVDLVAGGGTFGGLYSVLRGWIDDEGAQWDVIRRKLRFIGVTWRSKTSPKTWRWQQAAKWTRELPASAIRNVSLNGAVWHYLGNSQAKITPSYHAGRWSADWLRVPPRDAAARSALAEAVALVELGRTAETRNALARAMSREHAFAEPWLRSLALELRRPR